MDSRLQPQDKSIWNGFIFPYIVPSSRVFWPRIFLSQICNLQNPTNLFSLNFSSLLLSLCNLSLLFTHCMMNHLLQLVLKKVPASFIWIPWIQYCFQSSLVLITLKSSLILGNFIPVLWLFPVLSLILLNSTGHSRDPWENSPVIFFHDESSTFNHSFRSY